MRIAFPDRIANRHTGGNTTYTRHLIEGLQRRGHHASWIPSGNNPVTTILAENFKPIGRKHPEVLHFSADTGPLWSRRIPIVTTVHGVASRYIDTARTPVQEHLWRTRVQRAISSSRSLITVSHSSADDIRAVFDVADREITVIPHGIDASDFTVEEPDRTLLSRVPQAFALYLGNIEPRKNLQALVQAFESTDLRASIPLVIAGAPAFNSKASMKSILEASNTIYLGRVSNDERKQLMAACSIFVFPSLYEGFGFPVLEAMAAGAPVVCSRRGSLAEVSGPAFGIDNLTSEGIVAAVANALGAISIDPGLRARGKQWVEQFSWDTSVTEHLAVYERSVL